MGTPPESTTSRIGDRDLHYVPTDFVGPGILGHHDERLNFFATIGGGVSARLPPSSSGHRIDRIRDADGGTT